jgi:hypothetical protein
MADAIGDRSLNSPQERPYPLREYELSFLLALHFVMNGWVAEPVYFFFLRMRQNTGSEAGDNRVEDAYLENW